MTLLDFVSKSYLYSYVLLSNYISETNAVIGSFIMGGKLSQNQKDIIEWYPEQILNPNSNSNLKEKANYGIIILNRPIEMNPTIMSHLWKNAKIRCTVDKGTDRWISYLQKHNMNIKEYKPDLITGDFDSIQQTTIQKFSELGVPVISTLDQSATDFQKAVIEVNKRTKVDYLVVIVEHSGRIDHSFSNINTLFHHSYPIYLVCHKHIAWLLRPHSKHTIHVSQQFTEGNKILGLLPVGEPALNVTTTGLKWNLKNQSLQFGGMISSSNTYQSKDIQQITIQMGSGHLLWTMQLPVPFKSGL